MTTWDWGIIGFIIIGTIIYEIFSSRRVNKECKARRKDLDEYKNCLKSGDEAGAEALREKRRKDPYFRRHADEILKWRNFFMGVENTQDEHR